MGEANRPGIKFALFAVACALAAAWLYLDITNTHQLLGNDRYAAMVHDTSGLSVDDPVLLAGVQVGRVRALDIERGAARIEFDLERELPITDAWRPQVRWRDLLGQRYLQLEPADGGEPLEPGQTLALERALPASDLARLVEQLTPVLREIRPDQANELLGGLQVALEGRAERNQETLARLSSLVGELADRDEALASVLTDGATLTGALAAQDAAIRDGIDDLGTIGATLAQRNDELLGAVDDIAEGQGEIAALLDTNDARLRAALGDLGEIADSFAGSRDDFRRALSTGAEGVAGYMLISRWGQWFNIRGVAVQLQHDGQVAFCHVENGGACHEPAGGSTSASGDASGASATSTSATSASATSASATSTVAGPARGGPLEPVGGLDHVVRHALGSQRGEGGR